jgi:anti-sigma factor RsiW
MILKLHGHIGSNASALIDGQLSTAEEERAWNHILGCPGCRRLVEREGWIKQRLAGLAGPTEVAAPAGLLGALYDVDAWATVDEIERRSTRRRAAGALVGAGSVGLAVVALMAVTSPPAGRGEVPGRNPARIDTPASIAPGATRNGSTGVLRDDPGTGLSADVVNVLFGGRSR